EQVVEGAVLHHHDDDVLDSALVRLRQAPRLVLGGPIARKQQRPPQGERAHRGGRAVEKLTASNMRHCGNLPLRLKLSPGHQEEVSRDILSLPRAGGAALRRLCKVCALGPSPPAPLPAPPSLPRERGDKQISAVADP